MNNKEERTISVRGNGRVDVPPDSIIISIRVETDYKEYDKAMLLASNKIERLNQKFAEAGFNINDLKTKRFSINTKYIDDLRLRSDNTVKSKLLENYTCRHDLKIQFDFDTARLSKAIEVITGYDPDPKFSINFTVKDIETVKDEILKKATADAKRKAEVICNASGVTLGELIGIDCSWHYENFAPALHISFEDDIFPRLLSGGLEYRPELWEHFFPDDFSAYESVDFTWKIC